MQPADLDLYTTRELVDELMRRKTFLGIVIHSETDCKDRDWKGNRVFKVRFNSNLAEQEAGRLLETIADYMDRQNS